jgi:hypothetical protein
MDHRANVYSSRNDSKNAMQWWIQNKFIFSVIDTYSKMSKRKTYMKDRSAEVKENIIDNSNKILKMHIGVDIETVRMLGWDYFGVNKQGTRKYLFTTYGKK